MIKCHATVDIEGHMTEGTLVLDYSDINPDHDKFLPDSPKNLTNIILEIDHEKYINILYNTWNYFAKKNA
jgi:inosine-uridine nucleoside N-ribohydrolase